MGEYGGEGRSGGLYIIGVGGRWFSMFFEKCKKIEKLFLFYLVNTLLFSKVSLVFFKLWIVIR